jgi:hypothetical protein
MSPTAVPTRITIDFRDALEPSRTWILGLDEVDGRVDLLGFEARLTPPAQAFASVPRRPAAPTAVLADCACPAFCERDHANE